MTPVLDDWQVASTPPGAFATPPPRQPEVGWQPVTLPFHGSDAEDHWFRHEFDAAGDAPTLHFGGLATVSDVYIDGWHRLRSESMFLRHDLPVTHGRHELAVCARALAPLLSTRRRPRARWRSRVPRENDLRWIRTTLLGRAPGFAPGPPIVGPWRPVETLARPSPRIEVRTRVEDADGIVEIECAHSQGPIEVLCGGKQWTLPAGGGEVRLRQVARWWPHTHGEAELYSLLLRTRAGDVRRNVGFRELDHPNDLEREGLRIRINGVAIFLRGVVWSPVPDGELHATLVELRDAGLNMIRVPGTSAYESAAFYDACDELGLLVWQDMMFANMDYPIADGAFRKLVLEEIDQALLEIAGRPSLAVVCGNSEVRQQVGMLGLNERVGDNELFDETLPARIVESAIDAVYIPSAPMGGDQPFRTNRGVASYFGVGAYLRPIEDARRSSVLFASECLAFANVPDRDPASVEEGVMRDPGADWDFADVRDHYLNVLHGVGRGDPDYWDRARLVTGELMAEVFGEWRRTQSPCNGGIVLWSRDLEPGAGWGVLDVAGRRKPAWYFLRRALAPVTVWTTDEGLNGIEVHAANDTPNTVIARLRVAVYRDSGVRVAEAQETVELPPHSTVGRSAEAILGRFLDISYAYRFGVPQHHLVVTTLEQSDGIVRQDFRFPLGRPRGRSTACELGLEISAATDGPSALVVTVASARLLYGARISAAGFVPSDDVFNVEPGRSVVVVLRDVEQLGSPAFVALSALNLVDAVEVGLS